MNPTPIFLANPDVACHQDGPGAILVNPDTDAILGINPAGYLLWQALKQPRTQVQLVAYLIEKAVDAQAERVSADVDAFLQSLLPRGFIGQLLQPGASDYDLPKGVPVTEPVGPPSDPDSQLSELSGEGLQRFYRGHSMLGTFHPGDLLTITPVAFTSIRLGDVVLIRGVEHSLTQREVVHRVVAVTPQGLLTQGDNNLRIDRLSLTQERLIGLVTKYLRDGRVYLLRGGFWGFMHIRNIHIMRFIRHLSGAFLRAMVGWLYRWLRDSGLVGRFWRVTILRLVVNTNNGHLVKYIHGHRTVAKWRPAFGRFWACRPYDLLIPPPNKTSENPS